MITGLSNIMSRRQILGVLWCSYACAILWFFFLFSRFLIYISCDIERHPDTERRVRFLLCHMLELRLKKKEVESGEMDMETRPEIKKCLSSTLYTPGKSVATGTLS
jgi:hypothetical protein